MCLIIQGSAILIHSLRERGRERGQRETEREWVVLSVSRYEIASPDNETVRADSTDAYMYILCTHPPLRPLPTPPVPTLPPPPPPTLSLSPSLLTLCLLLFVFNWRLAVNAFRLNFENLCNGREWKRVYKGRELDLAARGGGDSSLVRAPDSWLKGRGFESLLERRENFLLQGRLSVLTLISVSVPPPCYHSST